MSHLSKKEIVELLTAKLVKLEDISNLTPEDFNSEGGVIEILIGSPYSSAKRIVEILLQDLEKAGVLMLVDDEPKEGDLIEKTHEGVVYLDNFSTEPRTIKLIGYFPLQRTDNVCNGKIIDKIIQRNSTPVYQCKKETANEPE